MMFRSFMKIVRMLQKGLGWLEEAFLCLLLGGMIICACLQIILRFTYGGGFVWIDPFLRYAVPWAGLFGAAVATKQGRHISIDLVSYLVPTKVIPWLHLFIHLVSTLVAAALTYAGVVFVQNEIAFGGEGAVLGIPVWGWNIVFPIAFGLMALRFLSAAFSELLEATGISGSKLPKAV